jgi:hypothetical protein
VSNVTVGSRPSEDPASAPWLIQVAPASVEAYTAIMPSAMQAPSRFLASRGLIAIFGSP